ncbi:MAG: hypothetical protein ABSF48_13320 [Thermodesulfobacteriota bacterium]|jgi:hypothetical protein
MKYWRSAKDSRFVADRRKDLDSLLHLLNAEIGSMNQREWASLTRDVARFQRVEVNNHRIGSDRIDWRISPNKINDLTSDWRISPEKINDHRIDSSREKIFSELQAHLRVKVEDILKSAEREDKKVLLEIPGVRRILISTPNRFDEEFRVEIPSGDPIEESKIKLVIAFFDLIRDLDLKPNRFKTCSRCGKFYYQPTARDKGFCSSYCGSAVRFKRYMDKMKNKRNEI